MYYAMQKIIKLISLGVQRAADNMVSLVIIDIHNITIQKQSVFKVQEKQPEYPGKH